MLPLEDAEFEILFDLVATRMILTVLITSWRADIQPENREYILRNAPSAWAGLERFACLGPRGSARLSSPKQPPGVTDVHDQRL